MGAVTFWLLYGIIFLFTKEMHVQTAMFDCYPAEVFENESVTLVFSFASISTYISTWIFNSTSFAYIQWNNDVCKITTTYNISVTYEMFCNSTTISIRIEKVQENIHALNWTGAILSHTNSTSVFVKVPVKYVNMSLQNGEIRYVENETATMECNSSLSRPQATNVGYIGQSYTNASVLTSHNHSETVGTYSYARSNHSLTVNRTNNRNWIFCNSSNLPDVASVSSNHAVLNIQYPPSVGQLENSSIIEGKHFTKLCMIQEGNPPQTNITWTNISSMNIIFTNTTLDIVNISRKHTSQYSCTARNMMTRSDETLLEGLSSGSFYLNVLFPPEEVRVTCSANSILTNISSTFFVNQLTDLILTCSANSNPSPLSYSWNGTITANQSQLSFNVNRNHSGDITCTAKNNMTEIPGNTIIGSNSKNIVMRVLFPPEISEMHNITIIEGKSVEFNGHVLPGNPSQTHFSWERKLDSKVWKNETFSIISVNRSDESEYTLWVNNTMKPTCGTEGYGRRNKTLYIKVLYPPEKFSVACLADNLRNERITDVFNITEGTHLTLECSANSNPPPSNYSWSGRIESSEKKITFYVNSSHSGDYNCTASNTMEEMPGSTTVTFKSRNYRLDVLYPPQISEMENITVIEGKPVEFKGNVTPGRPQEMQFYWTRQTDQQVWKSETFSISSVNRSQESEYTLSVSNSMRPTCGKEVIGNKNKTMLLKVLYPPEALRVTCLTDSSRNEAIVDVFNITEGTNLTLACSANSNPSPSSYSWSGSLVTNQSSLSFYVTKQHSGDYICTVNNIMKEIPGNTTTGTKSKMYRMSVLYAPEVSKMHNMTAVEGKRLAVYCNVTLGNPVETTIKWIRKSDNRTWYGPTMTIDNVTRHDDNTYTCIANNTLQPTYGNTTIGLTSQNVNVEILYMASIKSFVIEGNTNVNNVTVNETDLVTFRCSVESNPASFMKLTFEDKPLVEKNNTKDLVHVIYKANCTDLGTYLCYGHNVHNSLQNIPRTYINMYVNCAPRQSPAVYPATDVINITSEQHASRTVTFKALAYPKPSARWYKKHDYSWVELFSDLSKRILIDSSEDRLEYNLTVLNITQSDYGQYQLDITNSFGQHLQIFNLIPNDKPSSPKQFGVYEQNITETSVILWWEPGFDGGLPQMFIIGFREETVWKNYTSVEDTDATIMNVTVTGLRSGTQYSFCIYASNTLGSTRFPEEITITTKVPVETSTKPSIAGQVAGGVVGGALGILIIVALVFIFHKRRLLKRPMNEAKQLVKRPSIDATSHFYQNMNLIQDSKIVKRHLPPPLPEPDIALDTIDSQHNDEFDDTNENHYLNTQDIINDLKKITISELFSYVKRRPVNEFLDEYEDFPKGMLPSIPCVAASRPENVSLNRYQGIYPYDHSRVVITGQPDFFINASYINLEKIFEIKKGFSRGKAYIASLGPTVKHTHGFKTFWNMVWNEDTDVIVMLTNLQEPSGMKCEKYWADKGTTRVIGDFTIQSMSEEVAAEYTVRTFSVYKDSKSRVVTQLHYTAWPDKKVPEDVTSLIEFRQRVKASPTSSLGTLVVHCSAGIGRTGTYIALDRLIEEGKTTNSINVYDCVMNMRKQRVNMVQTPDQYVYLHQALVYCLVFDVEPITTDEIDEYIQTTSNNVFSKLFQQLQQSVEEESVENKEARSRNGDLVERNRRRADIPGDTHRIRLFLDKEMGESDYINAVYLNSFKRLEHFILAQSPLPATVDDFVAMLYQENCCCIVALDDHLKTGTNNAVYLPPENQSVSYGNFTISFKQLDSKPAYSVRKLKIGHSGRFEEGEKVAYHFEFNRWKHDEGVPNDAQIFVDLIKEVGEYATQLEDENTHVLVHCMTGSERSGLFCAVSNLIEKMGQERQVSVANTLRQIRSRRKSAIPNMDQLKFCYQAVNTFVKNYHI